jgi:zinc transport system substrate-binding protein
MIDISGCDLFIYGGGESDGWVELILASIDTSKIEIIRLMDCVGLLDEDDSILPDLGLWTFGEREPDEHVWTSVANARLITLVITERLIQIDPLNKASYEMNTTWYLEQLEELDKVFKNIIQESKHGFLVFGDRFPFSYFAQEYGLRCFAAFQGCSSATEPSAKTVSSLIDIVKKNQVPVVFYTELSNHRLANAIAEETGAQALCMHSCHNISAQDFENGETYISLMRRNAVNLKVALG